MEGLGVGSGCVPWPCLAADWCENRDHRVLGLSAVVREDRTGAFEFMSEVCLSVVLSRSYCYFLDSGSLPRTATGSLPASWRDGQPARFLPAASARWRRVGKGGGVSCAISLMQRCRVEATHSCGEWRRANLLPETHDAFAFRDAQPQRD